MRHFPSLMTNISNTPSSPVFDRPKAVCIWVRPSATSYGKYPSLLERVAGLAERYPQLRRYRRVGEERTKTTLLPADQQGSVNADAGKSHSRTTNINMVQLLLELSPYLWTAPYVFYVGSRRRLFKDQTKQGQVSRRIRCYAFIHVMTQVLNNSRFNFGFQWETWHLSDIFEASIVFVHFRCVKTKFRMMRTARRLATSLTVSGQQQATQISTTAALPVGGSGRSEDYLLSLFLHVFRSGSERLNSRMLSTFNDPGRRRWRSTPTPCLTLTIWMPWYWQVELKMRILSTSSSRLRRCLVASMGCGWVSWNSEPTQTCRRKKSAWGRILPGSGTTSTRRYI